MKHGVIKFDAAGTPTFESKNGIAGVVAGVGTVFAPSEGVVGIPKVASQVFTALVGNMLATQSNTGRIGLSAFGKTINFG